MHSIAGRRKLEARATLGGFAAATSFNRNRIHF